MYTLGNSVPLILQGASQREVLTPDQTLRVNTLIAERGGMPAATYTAPPTSKGFLASVAGDTPLWMLAAGGVVLATLISRR